MPHLVVTKVLPAVHRGDLAIAEGMLRTLRARLPEYDLTILCRSPTKDAAWFEPYGTVRGELFCRGHSGGLREVGSWGAIVTGVEPRFDDRARSFARLCASADALVFCGGGSPGGYGAANLVRHALLPMRIARKSGCPSVFTGLSLEPVQRKSHRWLTQRVLQEAAEVTVRDPRSLDIAQTFGAGAHTTLGADWAIAVPPADDEIVEPLLSANGVPSRPARTRVVMNLRDVNARGPEGAQRGGRYRALIVELMTKLLAPPEREVVVVSMTHSSATQDDDFAEWVGRRLPRSLQARFHVLGADLSPSEIRGVIETADVFVATRLHPLIFAIMSAVPCLALHDLSKVRGFMQLCEIDDWLVDVSSARPADIAARCEELIEKRDTLRAHLEAVRRRLPDGLEQNIAAIRRVAGHRATRPRRP